MRSRIMTTTNRKFSVKPSPSTYAFFLVAPAIQSLFAGAIFAQQPAPAAARRTPVVVELFTSEGCSSCPPADALLAKLESQQPFPNIEVLALEEHVDYWNNGGWTDPFSSDSLTLRQYVYASAIAQGNSYTPQMVVDGHDELIGSRAQQAVDTIERAATRKKADVSVVGSEPRPNGEQLLHIQVVTLPNPAAHDTPEVWLAITETGLHSDVKRGENAGEDLHHAAVVRKLRKIGVASASGPRSYSSDQTLKLDPAWKRENVRFVVFVQERKSKQIVAAGSAPFPATP
jgi:hypothetical protein